MIVTWDTEADYVVINEDVMLTCNVTSCPLKSIKKWIGGQNYRLLCIGDVTTNPSKYELMSDDTSRTFDLKIKNVTFGDFNCQYTCACGFQQYTKILKLDDSNYLCKFSILNKLIVHTMLCYIL